MEYIAILHQPHGCDYTIGCGYEIIPFVAPNAVEAVHHLKRLVQGVGEDDPDYGEIGSGYKGESRLDSVKLYEVGREISVSVEEWYQQLESTEAALQLEQKKRLFKQLKEELGEQ